MMTGLWLDLRRLHGSSQKPSGRTQMGGARWRRRRKKWVVIIIIVVVVVVVMIVGIIVVIIIEVVVNCTIVMELIEDRGWRSESPSFPVISLYLPPFVSLSLLLLSSLLPWASFSSYILSNVKCQHQMEEKIHPHVCISEHSNPRASGVHFKICVARATWKCKSLQLSPFMHCNPSWGNRSRSNLWRNLTKNCTLSNF